MKTILLPIYCHSSIISSVIKMIAFIRGKVFQTKKDSVVIDNQGIGYQIFMPNPQTLVYGSEVLLYTYQHVREDAILLFGFQSMVEQELFMRLIEVKGLGPKTAINILSVGSVNSLMEAIEKNDVVYLKSMPGIGAKTAQQIVLDLKGKLVIQENVKQVSSELNEILTDTSDALLALGYKQLDINKVIKEVSLKEYHNVDEAMRLALALLLNRK